MLGFAGWKTPANHFWVLCCVLPQEKQRLGSHCVQGCAGRGPYRSRREDRQGRDGWGRVLLEGLYLGGQLCGRDPAGAPAACQDDQVRREKCPRSMQRCRLTRTKTGPKSQAQIQPSETCHSVLCPLPTPWAHPKLACSLLPGQDEVLRVHLPQNALAMASEPSSHSYLAPIVLIGKLNVHIMFQADLCNHCPFSPNNFGMVFGVHSDTQLKAP